MANRMIDYRCETCGHTTEEFHHSDPPDSILCPRMIEESEGVSEGVCGGNSVRYDSMPGEYRPTNAKRFDPIVIWQSNTDSNKFSFPGRSNEAVDAGYHAIEITNMSQADYWTNRINKVYSAEATADKTADRMFFEERTKRRRDDIRARIGSDPRMNAFLKYMEVRRQKQLDKKYPHANKDVHFHIQALEFNQSNRMSFCDKDTDWKERRG